MTQTTQANMSWPEKFKGKNPLAYIECYGCNEGQLECAHLQSYLENNGFRLIDDPKVADLLILWGCALTEEKAQTSRLVAWKLSELRKPGAELLIWGCLPAIDPALVPRDKDSVAFGRRELQQLERLFTGKVGYNDVTVNHLFPRKARTWAEIRSAIANDPISFLLRNFKYSLCGFIHVNFVGHAKNYHIMTAVGCLSGCTYCSERVSCGRIQSKPKEKVVAEFKTGLQKGYRYFALSATDIGAYGRDLGYTLCDLLREITETEGDYSLLLYNINPFHIKEIWEEFQPLLETGKIAMLGISAECGTDSLLRLMGRRYTAREFEAMIRNLRVRFPRIFIKTEVMVGFPTEKEEDFRATIGLLDKEPFDHIDVYKFSRRPTVQASRFKGQVPEGIARRRFRQLLLKSVISEFRAAKRHRQML